MQTISEVHESKGSNDDHNETTTSSRLINVAILADSGFSNSTVLSSAIQVLDQISEVGKVLPFVSPAFVLLKIIIDLEKRALDVDVKCSDLVERITFMLSHVPLLQQIEITSSTRTVIDRMTETLKDCAALIAAYRKQGRIARRLRLTNRDKFTTCAEALSTCCGDLLITLQTNQSIKLDVLTRPVPADAEDAAAENFVSSHGGSVNAIVYDRALVKEFAQQQKWGMDDLVMQQLNTNITETIQQNHARLEEILRDNINTSLFDGLKSLARLEMLTAESEQHFACVQCEKEFTERSNGPKACSFHRSNSKNSRTNIYDCCGNVLPCQYATHRIKHHSDYPYGAFFTSRYSRRKFGLAGRFRKWAEVEDSSLEDDHTETATVGKLVSWTDNGPSVTDNILYIIIGKLWYGNSYYVDTFTAEELQTLNQSIRLSRRTLIFRNSPDINQYAMGEWVLSDSGDITGIRISAKTATSTTAYVCVCPIDLQTCTQSGPTITVSKGGLLVYKPASPYIVPKIMRVGPEFKPGISRPVRTDFKTETTPSLAVILKNMADPPLVANPRDGPISSAVDYFRGSVSVFNKNEDSSQRSISIASVNAVYRLVGDANYSEVDQIKFLDGSGNSIPFTVAPRQSRKIDFEVAVPRTPEDVDVNERWRDAAFLARHRPLRLKLIIEDFEGERCSLVLEYVFQLESLFDFALKRTPSPDEIDSFFCDNPIIMDRYQFRISRDPSNHYYMINHVSFDNVSYDTLRKIVYQAVKTGQTEIDLGLGKYNTNTWKWTTYALVDLSCQRVYAFKTILHDGDKHKKKHFGLINYTLLQGHGEDEAEEMRPISYANEIAFLPTMEPYIPPVYAQDDDFDDVKPPAIPAGSSVGSTSTGLNDAFITDISGRLASVDASLGALNPNLASINENLALVNVNLARLAAAFETLAMSISQGGSKHV